MMLTHLIIAVMAICGTAIMGQQYARGHRARGQSSGGQYARGHNTEGCTAPFILPNKPFLVVWNHPTSGCAAKGVDLDFKRWGIVDNSHDDFVGEQIALFYGLGAFSWVSGNTSFNGGIPQLGNLTEHLLKVESDIKTQTLSSFSGLGVIDFESWRPILWLNYDSLKIYQVKSLELAKQRFPSYNKSELAAEATREFNQAARIFIETTLKKVTQLRPGGKWGYYGYPRCWDSYCNGSTVSINDMIAWVFNSSSGLYPSIYFYHGVPANVTTSSVRKTIHETLRVRAKWASQDSAILPYSLMQDSPYDFFTVSDLNNSIREPADMGSSGVVLWGSSSYMRAKNECIALQAYLNNTLGPFSLQVTNFFSNCTQQLCQGHGRCVRKDYEQIYQKYLRESGRTGCSVPDSWLRRKNKSRVRTSLDHNINVKTSGDRNQILKFIIEDSASHMNSGLDITISDEDRDFDDYVCRCFAGWTGTHCDQTINKNKVFLYKRKKERKLAIPGDQINYTF